VTTQISQRGSDAAPKVVLAEETHASAVWGLVLLLPLVALVPVALAVPSVTARVATVAAGIVTLGAAALAWSGFRYVFTSDGLEIRTLGFRLGFVPREKIREYGIASWSIAGGYGIRGLGNHRAYVWGNKGVRVKTVEGEIFLGHSHPEQLVRDLDLMMQSAH
jgi:hypothetical protein